LEFIDFYGLCRQTNLNILRIRHLLSIVTIAFPFPGLESVHRARLLRRKIYVTDQLCSDLSDKLEGFTDMTSTDLQNACVSFVSLLASDDVTPKHYIPIILFASDDVIPKQIGMFERQNAILYKNGVTWKKGWFLSRKLSARAALLRTILR
jgi:hypothetical protein